MRYHGAMIALFSDFGLADPYVGQMHAVLAAQAAGVPVIDLFHHVPDFDIRAGAYLLPAYTQHLPENVIVVAIVDPGVGGTRRAVWLRADSRAYIGPDNGLFEIVARRAQTLACQEIAWQPASLSASFHGRDLFAPIAACLARGETPAGHPTALTPTPVVWPDDLPVVLYIDHYGNLISGLRASEVSRERVLRVGGRIVRYARTFAEAEAGMAFWYENSNGLVEIAVNQGRAADLLGVRLGDAISVGAAPP
jgi:hypothetical protein